MLRVHVGLQFKYLSRELLHVRGDDASGTVFWRRCASKVQEPFEEELDTEVAHGGAEKDRNKFAGCDFIVVEFMAHSLQNLDVLQQLRVQLIAEQTREGGVVKRECGNVCGFFAAAALFEQMDQPRFALVDPLEAVTVTYGPDDGVGEDAELLLDLVADFESVDGGAVEFVNEGEGWETAHAANFEEFASLRFEPLGAVDEHNGVVAGSEDAIGVLAEVGVTWAVGDIDAAV